MNREDIFKVLQVCLLVLDGAKREVNFGIDPEIKGSHNKLIG